MVIGNDKGLGDGMHTGRDLYFWLGKKVRKLGRLRQLAYCAALLVPLQALAQSPVLELPGPLAKGALAGHIDAFVDTDWSQTAQTMRDAPEGTFQAVDGKTANFGYTTSKIWLRTRLHNTSSDQSEWRVHFHENFKQVLDVYALRSDGQIDTLMSLNRQSTFSAREINFPEMVAPLMLAPGEEITLLIGLWSEGSSYITFSFETPSSFQQLAARQTAKNFIFYGMMMLLVTISMAAMAVFRHRLFLYYSGYATSAMLYVMHADGVTFQYLWPNAPTFNNYASVMAGTGIIIFGSFYARVFLKTAKRHKVMDWLLISVIATTVVLNVVLLPTNPQILKKLLVFMSLLAVISFTVSAIVAAFSHFREVRFYLFAWVGALMSAVLLNMNHLLGIEIGQDFLHDSMRIVMVFDAFMMGLAIADRYIQLRQSRQSALEQNLASTQKRLELNERLSELESQYQIANELAETRTEQIQNTIHDLRQPLHALRLSVQNLTSGRLSGDDKAHNIDDTFTYLERLVAEQLQQSPSIPAQQADEVGVQDVLHNIHIMFAPDAAAKGLAFRFHRTAYEASLDPLVLMRVVSNLVANAIKYTDSGGILLGTRRRNGDLLIEVHDTGPGLSPDAFDAAQARLERLDAETSDGSGLGLSIVRELAQQSGWRLQVSELRRSGTGIVITIPHASAANVTPFPGRAAGA